MFHGSKVAILITLLSLSCGREPENHNLLLITLDTTRADHLGCYGYFRDTTPNLDALAKKSILFENCFTPVATTFPSHLSLMTGAYPLELGVLANSSVAKRRFRSTPLLPTYAETAAAAGYRTAAFISATPLKKHTGINTGFETFDEPEGAQRRAEETVTRAIEWLRGAGDRPWFVWVHLFDPHALYDPPPPWNTRFRMDDDMLVYLSERRFISGTVRHGEKEIPTTDVMNLYDGEIAYMDSQIGLLLDALDDTGLSRSTAVVVVGDHGEAVGQHDQWHHGSIWDEQLRVPLLFSLPGGDAERIKSLLSEADVFPTLLAIDEKLPSGSFGRTGGGRDALTRKAKWVVGTASTRQSENPDEARLFSLTGMRWKLVHPVDGKDQLFDRKKDPHELRDLARNDRDRVEAMRKELEKIVADRRAVASRLAEPRDRASHDAPGPAVREELKSLGYVD